jgi:hypothetical protein
LRPALAARPNWTARVRQAVDPLELAALADGLGVLAGMSLVHPDWPALHPEDPATLAARPGGVYLLARALVAGATVVWTLPAVHRPRGAPPAALANAIRRAWTERPARRSDPDALRELAWALLADHRDALRPEALLPALGALARGQGD